MAGPGSEQPDAGTSGKGLPSAQRVGVCIAGTGVALPERKVTNDDLAQRVDTSDAWITKRTGIKTRYYIDGDSTVRDLARDALLAALTDAQVEASELDLVILATITPEMACPSTAARVAAEVGANPAGAFDLAAACSGFVYGLNLASSLIESGRYRNIAVIGAETLSNHVNHDDRRTCILFGDAAGAAIVSRSDDPTHGVLHQAMHSAGQLWDALFLPRDLSQLPADLDPNVTTEPGWNGQLDTLQMHGQEVFKFAVIQTCDMIQEALDATGLQPEDLALVIPHQSNQRIMATARDRFGLPKDKLYINIDRFGNTSAASVPLCLHECRRDGRIKAGDLVLFLAIGGGMTWSTSLWRV